MRLNSYNMAVKVLKAKGCFADMVDRMWGYMEEGDTENAQCVREKAIGLYALLETAGRWSPTIVDGYTTGAVVDYSPVTFPSPYLLGPVRYNGIAVSRTFTAYGGTVGFVSGLSRAANCFPSPDDDIMQVSMERVGDRITVVRVLSASPITDLGSDGSSGGSVGSQSFIMLSDNVPFEDAQPHCLTDAQILSIIGKIDELCECNC